jgi:methylase of polypeptide subunit release factors
VSGKDGLDDIRIIIKQAPQHLTNNGFLLLEHGYNQQLKIVDLLTTICMFSTLYQYSYSNILNYGTL